MKRATLEILRKGLTSLENRRTELVKTEEVQEYLNTVAALEEVRSDLANHKHHTGRTPEMGD